MKRKFFVHWSVLKICPKPIWAMPHVTCCLCIDQPKTWLKLQRLSIRELWFITYRWLCDWPFRSPEASNISKGQSSKHDIDSISVIKSGHEILHRIIPFDLVNMHQMYYVQQTHQLYICKVKSCISYCLYDSKLYVSLGWQTLYVNNDHSSALHCSAFSLLQSISRNP